MKSFSKFLLGSLLLTGAQFASSGCVSDGYVSESVYYGPRHRDPWFHDDPWMDGRRGYYRDSSPRSSGRVDVYISPPPPPRIRLP
ncbi:MAG: hypothetical protein JWQ83_1724 [Lacunisphaera sp.]|jgi:hypothetical protein|nr:hypothetical protein [Lacunisphaera sp.]MDB6166584.1 hypothetical protein [Lacunisphaera sp.]